MMLNCYFAIKQADKIYRSDLLLPLINKTDILEKYAQWNLSGENKQTYQNILDEYLKSRIDIERKSMKQEYNEKIQILENKFNEIKQTSNSIQLLGFIHLDLYNKIHTAIVNEINDYKRVNGKTPENMHIIYNYLHGIEIDLFNDIKAKLK